ncbi:MAG: CoA transferase [Acidobacteria bacterium]|nr:CoA transferase [Acidobacteriota bacterium]
MPLTGLRVVDLSRILAGPFATMMLGDMGAEVLKIERPGSGDDARGWGPPFVDGVSTYFLSVNRNKRSVTLDLKSEVGKDVLWQLIETADVVVSNFRVGVMDSLGFSFEQVAERAPRCVYGLINSYGRSGEQAQRLSFDVIIQAESGLMDLTGFADGKPTKVGVSIADEIAGLYLVQGILLALLERQQTGRGQLVEVALHDALLSMFTFQAQRYLSAGLLPQRMGNRHPSIVPYETFEAADGTIVVGVGNEDIWERFCAALGADHLLADESFARNPDRVANRERLEEELAAVFLGHPVAYWEERLGAAGVPCGRVRALNEVIERERHSDREMVVEVDGLAFLGVPIKLSSSPGRVRGRPPRLGEHTAAVLAELGHTEEEVAAWRDAGVI